MPIKLSIVRSLQMLNAALLISWHRSVYQKVFSGAELRRDDTQRFSPWHFTGNEAISSIVRGM